MTYPPNIMGQHDSYLLCQILGLQYNYVSLDDEINLVKLYVCRIRFNFSAYIYGIYIHIHNI